MCVNGRCRRRVGTLDRARTSNRHEQILTTRHRHPALDCEGEGSGTGNYDVIGPGLETTKAALDDRLDYYEGLYGGKVVELTDNEAALRVDGSNVVVATATPTAEGGFLVQEDYFCNSFQPQQNGPPDTEPLVTSDP